MTEDFDSTQNSIHQSIGVKGEGGSPALSLADLILSETIDRDNFPPSILFPDSIGTIIGTVRDDLQKNSTRNPARVTQAVLVGTTPEGEIKPLKVNEYGGMNAALHNPETHGFMQFHGAFIVQTPNPRYERGAQLLGASDHQKLRTTGLKFLGSVVGDTVEVAIVTSEVGKRTKINTEDRSQLCRYYGTVIYSGTNIHSLSKTAG